MDLSDVKLLYMDETSSKKGHNYVTVVCDQTCRVIYVTEGCGSETVGRLKEWLKGHGGSSENIEYVSCNLGEAYPKGVRDNFPNAVIVYDHFHGVKLVGEALDEVIKREIRDNAQIRSLRSKLRLNPYILPGGGIEDREHRE